MRILFITARFPFPLHRGDQLRAYHQLRLLSRAHRITLLSFGPRTLPEGALSAVAPFCEAVEIVPLRTSDMVRGALRAALSSRPIQTAIYESDAMRRAVQGWLSRQEFDLVHVQLARMATYLREAAGIPRTIDLIDALSLNMHRRSQVDRGPARWAARLEATRLRRYEQDVCNEAERAVVASAREASAVNGNGRVDVVTNGVDLRRFRFDPHRGSLPELIFSGNMGYFPNENATVWFVRYVFPIVRKAVPDVRLRIVGVRPTRAVRKLGGPISGVIVSGYVEDLAAELQRARVAVAPMQSGSGQQLKVLEAMAVGTPVVATPLAVAGITARDEEHALVAEDPREFAQKTVRLLHDEILAHRLAHNARKLVDDQYTWEQSVSQLVLSYEAAIDAASRRPVPGRVAVTISR